MIAWQPLTAAEATTIASGVFSRVCARISAARNITVRVRSVVSTPVSPLREIHNRLAFSQVTAAHRMHKQFHLHEA